VVIAVLLFRHRFGLRFSFYIACSRASVSSFFSALCVARWGFCIGAVMAAAVAVFCLRGLFTDLADTRSFDVFDGRCLFECASSRALNKDLLEITADFKKINFRRQM